jgi:hypothetical protein
MSKKRYFAALAITLAAACFLYFGNPFRQKEFQIGNVFFKLPSKPLWSSTIDASDDKYEEVSVGMRIDQLLDVPRFDRDEHLVVLTAYTAGSSLAPESAYKAVFLGWAHPINREKDFQGPFGRMYMWRDRPDLALESILDITSETPRNYYFHMQDGLPDIWIECIHSLPQMQYARCEMRRSLNDAVDYKISFYLEHLTRWRDLDAAMRSFMHVETPQLQD